MKTPCTKNDILAELYEVIRDRCSNPSEASYVSSLMQAGAAKIHEKIIEEASELTAASAAGDRAALCHEAADLWFHCLVLLGYHALHPREVYAELQRRRGISGIEEKKRRTNHGTGSA